MQLLNLPTPKKAFTLAEVLVTLAIIGIISALTIPTLLTNIQMNQYITAYKKNFRDINEAFIKVHEERGGNFDGFFGQTDSATLRDTFAKHLKYIKKCTPGNLANNCWASGNIKNFDGSDYGWHPLGTGGYGLVLANGASLILTDHNTGCPGDSPDHQCARIYLDTNGLKGPHAWGKDVYMIHINPHKLKPTDSYGPKYLTGS